jgi:hypothetical protein
MLTLLQLAYERRKNLLPINSNLEYLRCKEDNNREELRLATHVLKFF